MRPPTPVNRFDAFIDVTCFDDLAQRSYNVRFIGKVHCQVRLVPVPDNSEALELDALVAQLLCCEVATVLAKFCLADIATWFAYQAFDLVFDRQAMAIPTRYIR